MQSFFFVLFQRKQGEACVIRRNYNYYYYSHIIIHYFPLFATVILSLIFSVRSPFFLETGLEGICFFEKKFAYTFAR